MTRALVVFGPTLTLDPESFLVTRENELEPDELERARQWGRGLAEVLPTDDRTPDR